MKEQVVIDWGNTRVKAAKFSEGILLDQISEVKLTFEDLQRFAPEMNRWPVLLCSVTALSEPLEKVLRENTPHFIKLSHETPVPISIQYKTVETLGYDRLANAVAVSRLAPKGSHALAIDAGTCLKFDFVHGEQGYLGGAISPGLSMRYSAMYRDTDGLPLLERAGHAPLIGDTTASSMHSGAINGMLAEIEHTIHRYQKEFDPLLVYLTGGDAYLFEKALKNSIFAHSFLTLAGLNDILEFNRHA